MKDIEKDKKFPVKVDDKIYGPIQMDRIISDVKNGELTEKAKFWDGEDWVPVLLLTNDKQIIDDDWDDSTELSIDENGPPLNASSAWEDVTRKGRWIMMYGDHLVIEGGKMNIDDMNQIVVGEPRGGGIPLSKIINVHFKKLEKHVEIQASSFHKMYEVYSLKCFLSEEDSEELKKELEDANVRITSS